MTAEIDVTVSCRGWHDTLGEPEAVCKNAANATLRAVGANGVSVELSIVLADDALITGLNRNYRGQEGPTDVLSFPVQEGALRTLKAVRREDAADQPPVLLGDVVIAHETAMAAAAAHGLAPGDHLPHLIVHGVLHLLGYDHRTEAEAEHMEAMESAVLVGLGHPDPNASRHERRGAASP